MKFFRIIIKKIILLFAPIRKLYFDLLEKNTQIIKLNERIEILEAVKSATCRKLDREKDFPQQFYFFNSVFDPIQIIDRHAASNLAAQEGYLTNYLGVRINVGFIPPVLAHRAGSVEAAPIPSNWHADIAEFGAALRAVELASDTFTVIELGCGWGCWTNITGVAARRLGKRVKLIGVEGDTGHVEFARAAFRDNGFSEEEFSLFHGIAAANRGIAYFPKDDQSGTDWGKSPVFVADGDPKPDSDAYIELPMIALQDIVSREDRVDLLHIDIQGGEADLLAACIKEISNKAAYICIGTHSREIEGKLFETMASAEWLLEIERPAVYLNLAGRLVLQVDGVQGWRNPSLLP